MLIKELSFKGQDEHGNVFCQPLFSESGFEKTAAARSGNLHPRIKDFVRTVRPTKKGIYILVNALGASEYWGSNVNGDAFPEKSLIHAPADWDTYSSEKMREVAKTWDYGFPTFMNAHPFRHHSNKDPSKALGRVELAVWNPKMHRVELIVYLDRELCKKFDAYDLIERIERGEFPDVSMGCKVPFDVCTICENKSKTRHDYCEHALGMMNKILPDGRKVAVRNDHPKFFDISFVFIGADKTAKVMAKLAHKGNQVCMGSVCVAPSLEKRAYVVNIEKATEENTNYRKVLHTAKHEQLVAMALPPGGDIGAETHSDTDQFIRVESGTGKSVQDGVESPLSPGSAVVIHAGVRHNIVNTGKIPLKIYTVYSNKQHPDGIVEKTKADAKRMEKDANGDMLQYFQDHPKKLKEKQERDRKKGLKKTANDPIKKKVEIQGVPIWLEWLKGETRLYKKGKVVKYERLMKADYGYIPETKDSDGEDIDVYLGPDKSASTAYVIRQMKKSDGSFDEHKVMLGYSSEKAARDSYDYHMGGTKEFFGGIKPVAVSALKALFADNAPTEKKASQTCPCEKACTPDCCLVKDTEKYAHALFGISREKSASHKKLSEIIKAIPAGPFSKETLPRLERTERDIPRDVLDLMGNLPLGSALSTPSMMGMILKPREFQRIILVSIGEGRRADELDDKNMTFKHTDDIDESLQVGEKHVDGRLKELLSLMGLLHDRSAASHALHHRGNMRGKRSTPQSKTSDEPFMKKLAAAYNGYRRSLLKKANSIQQYMTIDPQLRADLFGGSMAQAFAGGIDKVASVSVFGPDSLAYLVGAYTNRDFHVSSKEVVASLALTGAVLEAA